MFWPAVGVNNINAAILIRIVAATILVVRLIFLAVRIDVVVS
jgi:hypothetical protein